MKPVAPARSPRLPPLRNGQALGTDGKYHPKDHFLGSDSANAHEAFDKLAEKWFRRDNVRQRHGGTTWRRSIRLRRGR